MTTGKGEKNFSDHSPWTKVQREVHQNHDLRAQTIKEISKELEGSVYTLFTSFTDLNAQIKDDDAEMLESLVAAEHDGEKLILVINSPGGQALAAERIVNVCRSYSDNNFEVIVPHMAKSAATMVCFGAQTIYMSKTGELGPVDPQIRYADDNGNERSISAEEYVRSYEELIKEASSGKAQRIEPFIQQLNRYDSRYVERLKSVQDLSKDISIKLLKSGMMSKESNKNIEAKIQVFLSQKKTNAHGRMINHDEAKSCGLNISTIPLQTDLWNKVWELFIRSDWCVTNRCSSLIESQQSSLIG